MQRYINWIYHLADKHLGGQYSLMNNVRGDIDIIHGGTLILFMGGHYSLRHQTAGSPGPAKMQAKTKNGQYGNFVEMHFRSQRHSLQLDYHVSWIFVLPVYQLATQCWWADNLKHIQHECQPVSSCIKSRCQLDWITSTAKSSLTLHVVTRRVV